MTNEAQSPAIIPEQVQLLMRLENIFMPYATRQRRTLFEKRTRLVHYTSAEAALGIIESKRLWMRNATCMSDYSEVQHGFQILDRFFSDPLKKKAFVDAVDICFPGVALEAITLFNQWWNDIRFNTYVASISEHDDREDSHGRLSMWRAFGGNTARVAIVFRIPEYSGGALALNLMFSPVAYLTEAQAHDVIHEVIKNVRDNCEFLRSVNRPLVLVTVVAMLVAGVVCLKHEGFHEEREWRAIYAPKRNPSPLMESSTEIIGGIPQIIYRIPLDATVSDTLADLDLFRMFDRLIIGPSPYPWPMYEAFVGALAKAGVASAENRVFASNIPIRV
ncbi:MAG: DUF2971 domain-containing protein [Terriglobales bacterium]